MSRKLSLALLPALLASACNFAPDYRRPAVAIPPAFKELPGWRAATPSDAVARGEWWSLFGDPVLDGLERRVIVSNQNLAVSKAAFDQAQALVREQRAALFPTLGLATKAADAGGFARATTSVNTSTTTSSSSNVSTSSSNALQFGLQASWAPDLWGQIGNTVKQAGAQAQASQADLVNATLSAQSELALDYLQMRGIEAQKVALDNTVAAYTRALGITQHLYESGVSARSDVIQAETSLRSAEGDDADLDRQRALLEHAIAVLAGENPSTFSLPVTTWNRTVPEIPSTLPSDLLERRPDIAAAERQVAAANANIGIQRSAFFPSIGLTGQAGFSSNSLSALFTAAGSAWSLGLSGALALLDFGARSARVDEARAAYEQSVATYRQTVLTAFQQTEDQLATVRVLRTVTDKRQAAAADADRAEAISRIQYVAGQNAYSAVIVAQTTALTARTAEIQAVVNQQVAAVSLIEAVGGRWDASPPAGAR